MDVAGKLHGYYETFFPWGGNWFKIQMMHGVFFWGGVKIFLLFKQLLLNYRNAQNLAVLTLWQQKLRIFFYSTHMYFMSKISLFLMWVNKNWRKNVESLSVMWRVHLFLNLDIKTWEMCWLCFSFCVKHLSDFIMGWQKLGKLLTVLLLVFGFIDEFDF